VVDEARRPHAHRRPNNLTIKPDGDDIAGEAMVFALPSPLASSAPPSTSASPLHVSVARPPGNLGPSLSLTEGDRKRLVELQANGLSHRAIAVTMKLPKATVTYALKRPAAAL
jgi:hypothetical protein